MSMNKDNNDTTEQKTLSPGPSSRIEKKAQSAGKKPVRSKKKERPEVEKTPSDEKNQNNKEIGWYGMPMSRKRQFPIWLRLLTLFVLCAIALVAGAMIGFGVVGHGHALDVFRMDTWIHIMKFITKGT